MFYNNTFITVLHCGCIQCFIIIHLSHSSALWMHSMFYNNTFICTVDVLKCNVIDYIPVVFLLHLSRSLIAGLVWVKHSSGRVPVQIRHMCEHEDGLDRYGWMKHDGVSFGEQEIIDGSE